MIWGYEGLYLWALFAAHAVEKTRKDSSMSKQQSTEMKFCPQTGALYQVGITASGYRAWFPSAKWLFDPWTGEKRDQGDVDRDPYGLLLLPPGEPTLDGLFGLAIPMVVADQDKPECPYAGCYHPNGECAGKCTKSHAAASALDDQVAGDHYKKLGAYQPWEVLRRWLTPEEFRGFMKGSAIAYLARERDKGGSEDVAKAEHYLRALLELEGKNG